MSFSAIVVAAGSGSRAGGPKQWRALGGRPLLAWSVGALLDAGADEVVVVVPGGAEDQAAEALTGLSGWRAVAGGATRAESVQAGLAALSARDDTPVLIHDAARPFLTADHVARLLDALDGADAALLALPVPDTLKTRGRRRPRGRDRAARGPVAGPDAAGGAPEDLPRRLGRLAGRREPHRRRGGGGACGRNRAPGPRRPAP